MTREEAIVMQKAIRDNLHETGKDYPYRDDMIPLMKESCDIAINALEQEPCEDCISRQTLDEIKELMTDINGDTVYAVRMSDLRQLPSITPQQRVGQWIYDKTIENWRCSECNETPKTMGYVGTADFMAEHFKFCNHCGAKMERSDK